MPYVRAVLWLVYRTSGGVRVLIQPAITLLYARLAVTMHDGEPGDFVEAHPLDQKLIKRTPKDMIGKQLTAAQAQRLLTKLERPRA